MRTIIRCAVGIIAGISHPCTQKPLNFFVRFLRGISSHHILPI